MQQYKQNVDKFAAAPGVVHETEFFQQEARIAVALIERWGAVAAVPDGEDSTGRQQCRLQTPQEVVERAFETAGLIFEEARKRGLILVLPDVDVIYPDKVKAV